MTILYVPGLGDRYDGFRRICLTAWKLYGVEARLVPMKWTSQESFEDKLMRLRNAIDEYDDVILVGESAGGTMVLHIAEEDPRNVVRYVTLCGVCQADMPIADRLNRRNPALLQAGRSLSGKYPRKKLRHYEALYDSVVPARYSSVEGFDKRIVLSLGHFFTITLCLTLYAPWFSQSIRRS